MKKLLLFSISVAIATVGAAQFTQDDFPREATFTDQFIFSYTPFDLPEHGTDQLWDFSSAEVGEEVSREYIDATGDPNFPGALSYRERDQIFQGFIIESNEYETVNEDGFSVLGRSITDVVYSITGITGGADDELRFVGGNYLYSGNYDYLVFPFDYGDSWVMEYQTIMPFELTVAGFGLNSTPGQQVRNFTETREVVGQGSFIIPDEMGDPSLPIPGYLIRAVRTAIDSVYLMGNPAPAPLMAAFGLTQGAAAADSFYVAYAHGFGMPLMGINIDGNQAGTIDYRPAGAALGQDPTSVNDFGFETFEVFPNPAVKGQVLNIQANSGRAVAGVQLFNLSGQKVYEESLNREVNSGVALTVPGDIKAGLYFVNLLNAKGETIGQNKLVVQ